jgi:hypothetical protein
MVAIASLSAGTLVFRKFPPSSSLKNDSIDAINPHCAVALGTNEGHLVPITLIEFPTGKQIKPDALRNLEMLEEFEIKNPSEFLHFEIIDVERKPEGSDEEPKYSVIGQKSISVSYLLEDDWAHKLYGHCFKYIDLDSPDGKEKNVCTMKLQMDYKVIDDE